MSGDADSVIEAERKAHAYAREQGFLRPLYAVQCSTSGAESFAGGTSLQPTATQSLADVHDTPLRSVLPDCGGFGTHPTQNPKTGPLRPPLDSSQSDSYARSRRVT
jgi:hypothetical protein